jgi:hypothetical protein
MHGWDAGSQCEAESLMMAIFVLGTIVTLMSLVTDGTDPRLKTVTRAYISPFSESDEDRMVAACFVDHVATTTPLVAVHAKPDADVLISIRAHLPGDPARPVPAGFANVRLVALLPNGTKLWSGIEVIRNGDAAIRSDTFDLPCTLADRIAGQLKQAISSSQQNRNK